MTKKDYIKIAKVLIECNRILVIQDSYKVTDLFCKMLEFDNTNFNKDKFINYIEKG